MSGTKKNWKTCHKRIWNWIWYSKRFKESFLLPFVFVETFKFTAQLPKLSLKLLEAKLIFHRSVKWFLCLNKCFLSRCRSSNYRLWQQRMPARKFPSKSIKSFLPFCVLPSWVALSQYDIELGSVHTQTSLIVILIFLSLTLRRHLLQVH